MNRYRVLYISLSVLALVLVGTVAVLSSITYYLSINPTAYLTELDVPNLPNTTRWNATELGRIERIPRIIHQTWKTDDLPLRWKGISRACRDMTPDYEYKLWTDASSREFIATHYSWFLQTFDSYKYPIQRADVIRYFVLHYYGGVYMDLDIGCLRPMDPLLAYPVILPKTVPVGVSNDLIFAEKGHAFLEQTIHNLVTFDHSWVLNYPTVMFSTGPMFLSAQYAIYASSHPTSYLYEIRILPKALYGKNAKEGEAPHSFFSHFYGSSWHADDAAFIGFLGTWGKGLMWVGLAIFVYGIIKLSGTGQRKYTFRRISGYDILLPRWSQRSGRWQYHGWSASASHPSLLDDPGSPIDSDVPVLHLPFDIPPSPSPSLSSEVSAADYAGRTGSPIAQVFQRIRNRMATIVGVQEVPRTPVRPRRQRRSRSVLFFLPAIFTHPSDIELAPAPLPRTTGTVSRTSQLPPEKTQYHENLESAGILHEDPTGLHAPDLASSCRSSEDDFSHSRSSSRSSPSRRSRSRSSTLLSWNS